MEKERRLHIGCGDIILPKPWENLDGREAPGVDHVIQGLDELPFKDNTFDVVYAAHTLEHIPRNEVEKVLREWVRITKPDGIVRLAVPDFENMCFLYKVLQYPIETFLGPLYGQMSMGDETIYHKTTYDFNSLKSLLEDLGMKDIKKYDWKETEHAEFDDHSQAYIPHMDKENGTLISLNMECTK